MKPIQWTYLFFILFVLIVGIGLLCREGNKKKIMKHHVVLCGKILSIKNARGGPLIDYEFVVSGKKIIMDGSCMTATQEKYEEGINSVMVVFEKDNPYNCELLESKSDFIKFGIMKQDTNGLDCFSY